MDASGKSAEELLHSDDKTLSQVMVRDSGHRNTDSEKLDELTPLLEDYARQMQLRNMTYQLLFENYSQRVAHPYGYTQFKEKLQAYEKAHSYSFHNVYEPAGEMQVDYAGDRLWIMDPRTRVGQEAYVLVCVLPFSSLAFVTDYFDGLSRCLTYFGGVPLVVKSDNMRQWVKKYDRYEPATARGIRLQVRETLHRRLVLSCADWQGAPLLQHTIPVRRQEGQGRI
jgi:transposase